MTQQKASADTRTMSAAGLRAFFNIAELWKLSNSEQACLLGAVPESTFYAWKKDPEAARLSKDTLERLSYIMGIYKDLQILLTDRASADEWVRKPNKASLFNGKAALDLMLNGNVGDLYAVRRYLDSQAAGARW